MTDFDPIWEREEIQSPCVKLCVIHEPSGLCMGCYRSRPEIAGWSQMSADKRALLMLEFPTRAPLVKGVRRKRR